MEGRVRGWLTTAAIGAGAGLAASYAMAKYQALAAPLFGVDQDGGDSATVKAADSASESLTARPVPDQQRQAAGNLVHYATGAALGLGYALAARRWQPVSAGFGIAYGLAVAAVFDDVLVPLFGWGPWPHQAGLASQGYSVSAHAVYGVALEGSRRLAMTVAA